MWVAAIGAETSDNPWNVVVQGDIIHANTVSVGPLGLRDVAAIPSYRGRELTFTDFRATAYGGTITGIIAIHLDTGIIRCRLDINGCDLGSLLRELGGNISNLSGTVDGWIACTMESGRERTLAGQGALTIRNGTLMQLPILAELLVGDVAASKGQDNLTATMSVSDGRILVTEAVLTSPSATVRAGGWVDVDGRIRLGIEPTFTFQLVDRIPALGSLIAPVLGAATRAVARVQIRGSISAPVLVPTPFAGQD